MQLHRGRMDIAGAVHLRGIDVKRDRQQGALALPQAAEGFYIRRLGRHRVRREAVERQAAVVRGPAGNGALAGAVGAEQLKQRRPFAGPGGAGAARCCRTARLAKDGRSCGAGAIGVTSGARRSSR